MDNGKPPGAEDWRDNPPIPHSVGVGQSLQHGHMWVGIKISTPGVDLTILMDPHKAKEFGQAIVDSGNADQAVLAPKNQLIVPGSDT